ncbi:MAG TPA: LamG domain-containing protein, partial [Thermoguttaceae bacterium]|nr:LamG domain-containing protein [Thermoguttaceae bacterium]
AFSRVELAAGNTDVVAVDAAGGDAFNLTVDGGGLHITDGTLAVTGAATFAPGTSLVIDGGRLTAGAGGSIASLQFVGTATLDVGQNTPVASLSDGGVAGTFVKRGGGTVVLNNSSGAGVSAVAGTAFRVEEGTLQTRGTNPLGQATQLDMAGGTFRLLDPVAEAGSFTLLIPPIAGWTFDADTGLIAQNVMAPGTNDGVLTNFADDDSQWVAGKVGQALYLDGGSGAGNDDWVDAGAAPWDLGATAYSITMWARATDLVQSHLNESVFTSKPVSGAGGFQMDFTNANNGDYRWHGDVGDMTFGPVDTEWVHLAVTYDAITGTLTTYYNGQLASTGPMAAHNFTDYMIGRNRQGDRRFEGTLDEVFVYDHVLLADDVAQMAHVPPTDVSNLSVTVTGDSTLQLDTAGEPVFGTLTLRDGILITTGRAEAVTFASTVIHPEATHVGIGPEIPTDLGNPLDATGTALEVFSKGGSGKLTLGAPDSIVAFAPAGMTGVTIDAHDGELVMVGDDAWGGSNEIMLSGGSMTIATSPGFQSPGGPGLVAEFYGSQIEPFHLWDGLGWTSPILAGADGTGFDPFTADAGGASLTVDYPAGGTNEADGDVFGNLFGPISSQYGEDFAVRFSGQILMEDWGDYNFTLLTNAGGAVWIDGQAVVTFAGSDIPDDPIPSTGIFTVPVGNEGQWHDIVVGYYDLGGQSGIELTWDHGNQGDGIDPQYLLHEATPGATAPIAMTTHTVEVTADSTLKAVGPTADFGALTLTGGILTTAGAPDGMSFASTTLTGAAGINAQTETDFGLLTMMDGTVLTTVGRPVDLSVSGVAIDAGAQRVGLDPQVETDYGILDANGAAVAIAKTGTSNWVLDAPLLDATSNAGSASIEVEQGTLTLAGTNLFHGRPVKVLEGGTLLAQSAVAPLPGNTVELAGGTFTVSDIFTGAPGTGTAAADPLQHWAFDDGSGITAQNGVIPGTNDGTLLNFPGDGSEWVTGMIGGALQFDGVDDQVQITDYKGISGATPRTVAAWVKTTTTDGPIIAWGTNTAGKKWIFRTYSGGDGQNGAMRMEVNGGYVVGETDLRDGQWHHVAAVLPDGATNVNKVLLYVDGRLEGISGSLGNPINTDPAGIDVLIGSSGTLNNGYLAGAIDDVFIYDRALTTGEIQGMYAPWTATDVSATNLLVTSDSIVRSQSLEPVDFGGLTLGDAVLTTAGNSPIGFTGTTFSPGTTAAGVDLQVATELGTIDAAGTAADFVFSKSGPVGLTIEAGTANQLANMTGRTVEAAGGKLTMIDATAWAGATGASLAGGTLRIEATWVPDPGPGPVGAVAHYAFDFDAVTDSTGNLNDGTANGDPQIVFDALLGNVLQLDGVDDYIAIPRTIQDDFTMAFWLNSTQAPQGGAADPWYNGFGVVDGEVAGAANDFGTSVTGGLLTFGLGTTNMTIRSMDPVNDGQWHHVAVTRDQATGEMKLYMDGLLQASGTGMTGPLDAPTRLTIGEIQTDLRFYAGMIDDVYLYDTVLSEGTITAMSGTRTLDFNDKTVTVKADSTLSVSAGGAVPFGELILESGIMTTEGTPVGFASTTVPETATISGINAQTQTEPGPLTIAGGVLHNSGQRIEFDSTTIPYAATAVGFEVEGPVEFGVITGEGHPDTGEGPAVTISKSGSQSLILSQASVNLDNATFAAQEGVLKMIGADPWGGSTRALLSGGTLHLVEAAAPPVPEGAIAVYPFDNGALPGFDLSGSGRNGVFLSGATLAGDGMVGSAVQIDGIGEGVNLDPGGGFLEDATSARTVAMWINQTDATGNQLLFDEGGTTNGIGLRVLDGIVEAKVKNGSNNRVIATPDVLSPGWHHLAFAFGDSTWTLYLDGQPLPTATTPFTNVPNHNNGAGIGYKNSENTYNSALPFNGLIDEVYIYEDALDAAEITQLIDAVGWVPQPLDYTSTSFTVTADSTLYAESRSSVAFGPLTLVDGILTVGAVPDGATFANTTLAPAAPGAMLGIRTEWLVDPGQLIADGVTPMTFSQRGPGDLILDQENIGLDAVTVESRAGR